jgi:hypothetical protein
MAPLNISTIGYKELIALRLQGLTQHLQKFDERGFAGAIATDQYDNETDSNGYLFLKASEVRYRDVRQHRVIPFISRQ